MRLGESVEVAYQKLNPEKPPQDFDQFITKAERTRVAHAQPARQHAFLSGRYLTRKTIADVYNLAAQDITIMCHKTGKPFAQAAGKHIAVSISHNNAAVACAVSHDFEVGIDIESKTRKAIQRKSWSLAFTETEQAVLYTLDHEKRHRLSLFWWCLKEAAYKISGQGTFTQLDCSPINHTSNDVVSIHGIPDSWQLQSLDIIPAHFLTLCVAT